ncbi:hypothetical protein ACUOA5_17305, partial [Escherichia coli]
VSIYPQWMQWNNLLWSIASILPPVLQAVCGGC